MDETEEMWVNTAEQLKSALFVIEEKIRKLRAEKR
jgi:hypothetical protein